MPIYSGEDTILKEVKLKIMEITTGKNVNRMKMQANGAIIRYLYLCFCHTKAKDSFLFF